MQLAVPGITINLFKTRNFIFFVAVLLMQWTLLRPTPADIIFMSMLCFTLMLNPTIHSRVLIFFVLIFIWIVSIYFSSIHVMDDPAVRFQLLAHTFIVLLGLTACLVATSWGESNYLLFLKVYLTTCCIASVLGLLGFAGGVEMFLFDGRASALFDEPNGFGGFLLPGVLAAMYLLSRRHGLVFPAIALLLCVTGVVISFSRAALLPLIIVTPMYFVFLNRRNLLRASIYFVIGMAIVGVVGVVMFYGFEGFQEKLLSRMTVAKDYDLGHFGRWNRYLLSIPMILDNPTGLGMLEIDKYFPEPIHNLFISSFLNYGWLAGVVWILLTLLTFKIALQNYKATQSPILIWLSFSLLTQFPAALLQQVEHWRHLWLFLGLFWGLNVRNFPAPKTAIWPGLSAPPQPGMQHFQ